MESYKKSKNREEILQMSLSARVDEVMHYQINIDNYTLALAEITEMSAASRAELSEFSAQLSGLLESERLEQKKAKIMLTVIEKQLGAKDVG